MTVCAIMQPTYLPWVGYLDLVDQVDVFVFLDNVQFARRSWQQRNQLRSSNGLEWISVPVIKAGRRDQKVSEVEIQVNDFPNDHIASIERLYRKSRYFGTYWAGLRSIIAEAGERSNLSDLNQAIIRYLCAAFGIVSRLEVATKLGVEGTRSDLLAKLCKTVGANRYLSPPGSVHYLREDNAFFSAAGIQVAVQAYSHPLWTQLYQPFIPYASSIDLLFNHGPESLGILRSGRHPVVPIAQWTAPD